MPITKGSGNPKWTRDETILALDLYLRLGRAPGPAHPDIVALSALLNRLPWHSSDQRTGTFRNPDGVSLKILNIRSFERGRGLSYSKVDAAVFTDLASNSVHVASLAETIRKAIDVDVEERVASPTLALGEAFEWEFAEGRLLTSMHVRRERNPKVRKALIAHRRNNGLLACDLCQWSYASSSADFAEAAFEAHHLVPLAQLIEERRTALADLSLLCANCHRLLHRAISLEKRWLSMEEARSILGSAS